MTSAGASCQAEGITFIPLVFESLGGWEDRAVKELKKLASALARHSGEDEADTWRKLIVRISILLMKGKDFHAVYALNVSFGIPLSIL